MPRAVCRLEDAATRKPKQSLTQFGNVAKRVGIEML